MQIISFLSVRSACMGGETQLHIVVFSFYSLFHIFLPLIVPLPLSQTHCACSVSYRPWVVPSPGQAGLGWVLSSMNTAHMVVFVTSPGAEKVIEADMAQQVSQV